MNVTQLNREQAADAVPETQRENQAKLAELRKAAEQVVGITFFQTLLQTAHNSSLKGKYGHGGRGEEVFTQQLDVLLAEQMAASSRFALVEEIYDRMAKRYLPEPVGSGSDPASESSVYILG